MAAEEEEAPEATELEETVGAGEMSLEDLGLSTRLINVLAEAGVETVQDILTTLAKGDAEFLSIPGAGGKSLEEVRERLTEHALLDSED